ncbi:MAG: BrnA antitoxin family protein [Deltaproteobacteria bacterium]|nr:BrnA antitoxin family protein [Deltaproteobacteria bacterium]
MKNRKDDPAERPDKENPEWSAAGIKKARPALDTMGEVFGEHAREELRRGRGCPRKEDRKVNQTLRIDAEVLEAYRRGGPGWQTRINKVLCEQMPPRN